MSNIVRFLYLIEIFVFWFLFNTKTIEFSNELFTTSVLVGVVNIFLLLITRSKYHIPTKIGLLCLLFSVGYLIVYYQKYIDLLIGNISISDNYIFISPRTVIRCAFLSNAGFSAFALGYLTKYNKKLIQRSDLKDNKVYNLIFIRLVYYFSTIIFVVLNWRKTLTWSYSQAQAELEAGTWVQYSDLLFQVSFILLLTYIVHNSHLRGKLTYKQFFYTFGGWSHICLLIYSILMLLIGDRGPLIICGSAYFGAYALCSNYVLKKKNLLAVFVLSAVFFSLIGRVRTMDRNISMRSRIDDAIALNKEVSSVSTFSDELATSVMTLHYSVENVPEKYNYLYGTFILRYAISCIPFADGIISSFWNPHWKYRGSAFFITWLIQGDDYSYGNGTCCNADLYLGFGIIGVVIGLFLWGYFYAYLERKARINGFSIIMIIIYLFTLGYAFYVCRASFLSYSSDIVFTILLHLINANIMPQKSK